MKIFTNHRYALVTGIVLAVVLSVVLEHSLLPPDSVWNPQSLARWVHIVSGVFWIGLLYYFNAVQTPALADAAADKGGPGGAGVNKYVAPRALFWFRWSALATWLAGAWLLGERFVPAFTFGLAKGASDYPTAMARYTFGDSKLAAERLDRVATTFAATSRALLEQAGVALLRAGRHRPGDLGRTGAAGALG